MKLYLFIIIMLSAQIPIVSQEELRLLEFCEYGVLVTEKLPEDLSQYEVVIISTPSTLYDEQEIEALKTYVHAGGGLMLLAEENNKEGTTLVLNEIAEEFSITFNTDRIYDDVNYVQHTSWITLTRFPPHPVFEGITTIVYTTGCSLTGKGVTVHTSPHAYAERYDEIITHQKGDTPACMIFSEPEGTNGRVFACGDKELFDTYISQGDNTLFGMNLLDWLTGNEDQITMRLTYKKDALPAIRKAQSVLQTARENGLHNVFSSISDNAETLIEEAENLYNTYKYSDAYQKASAALQLIEEGERKASAMVSTKKEAAQQCLAEIEGGAQKYLPSQYEAALYYLQEIEQQRTYSQKMEKADQALQLCEEIHQGLKGAAEKEIRTAAEKVDSYRGLFGRSHHHSARVYLEYAEESYEQRNYGDAIEFAEESQTYSGKAAEEQKKDYILAGGVVLAGILISYIYVRRR